MVVDKVASISENAAREHIRFCVIIYLCTMSEDGEGR